jgi:UDP-N-acetylglucosamine--dolichyl-phosphate N-acetylglucosaminephosphotransferase
MSGIDALLYGAITAGISFATVMFLMPWTIRSLTKKGKLVKDYHKPSKPDVPRPAGPVIMIGIAVAETVAYLLTMNSAIIAILLTTGIAFIVGYADDTRVMPGWFKPVALLAAAIPLIVFQAHADSLNLAFGAVIIPLLYVPLIFVVIPVAGNTINSIDVLNGVASGFVIISIIPLIVSIAIFGSGPVLVASIPLLGAAIAFYKFHKYPSRIFPGDSGTLLMGAMYGALAVAGRSEIIGVIALLPAVMNSFLFLASVKRFVEHRQVARPVMVLEDFRLAASKEKGEPTTLVRMILADGPLSEKEIGSKILRLAIF